MSHPSDIDRQVYEDPDVFKRFLEFLGGDSEDELCVPDAVPAALRRVDADGALSGRLPSPTKRGGEAFCARAKSAGHPATQPVYYDIILTTHRHLPQQSLLSGDGRVSFKLFKGRTAIDLSQKVFLGFNVPAFQPGLKAAVTGPELPDRLPVTQPGPFQFSNQ